jgi:hypothetical protein
MGIFPQLTGFYNANTILAFLNVESLIKSRAFLNGASKFVVIYLTGFTVSLTISLLRY